MSNCPNIYTVAKGSISTIRESSEKNKGKEANFPYFFRTIAENQQYK